MCTPNEDSEFIAQAKTKGALGILAKSTAPGKLASLLDRLTQAEEVPEAERLQEQILGTQNEQLS